MFVGLESVILRMMFVIPLGSQDLLLCLLDLFLRFLIFLSIHEVWVFYRCFCMSHDVRASDNSYQKNIVVIVGSPCMSYDARASDNSYQKNCVVILRLGNQFLSGLRSDP